MNDIWQYLKTSDRPVVMYGMGNGADKILARCAEKGIVVSDFFASDSFVRGHSFHGKRVLTLGEVEEKYGDFTVLLSFGTSLPDVLEAIRKVEEKHELFAPDVPVAGGGTFDAEFFAAHEKEINSARELFCDERSKETYDNIIKYKLTGRLEYLRKAEVEERDADGLLRGGYRTAVDAGAYNGDTAKKYLSLYPTLERIYTLEPDPKTYKKLLAYAESEPRVTPVNAAAYSFDGDLTLDASANRNANVYSPLRGGKTADVKCARIDSLTDGKIDFIKYDVEGAERDALLGTERTIKEYSPDLIVSAYHRNEDIFALPALIKSLRQDYDLYLRKLPGVPAWDVNVYAVRRG